MGLLCSKTMRVWDRFPFQGRYLAHFEGGMGTLFEEESKTMEGSTVIFLKTEDSGPIALTCHKSERDFRFPTNFEGCSRHNFFQKYETDKTIVKNNC